MIVDQPRTDTLNSLQDELGAWGDRTFGVATQASIIAHLRDEVNEELDVDCEVDEIADCFILLLQLCHKRNISADCIIRSKHAVNLKRKWGEPDERGVVNHIKEGV